MNEHLVNRRILADVARTMIVAAVGSLVTSGCSNRVSPSDADARAKILAKGERIRVIGERSILEFNDAKDADLEDVAQLHGLTDLSICPVYGTAVTDTGLAHLSSMKSLVHLSLRVPGITDAGLVHLKGLTGLESLSLRETQVTGDGLKSLKGLKNLRSIDLHGSPITDEGLSHLRGFAQLRHLDLWNTRVSDEGLKHLAALKNLQSLNLWGTKVTNAGLGYLRSADLHALHLSGKHVTDETLAMLKGFPNLKELNLALTKVTDAGVVHLKAIKRLRWLTFETTGPTEAAIMELKRALPLTDDLVAMLAEHQVKQPDRYTYVFVPPERYELIQKLRKQGKWSLSDARLKVINNFRRKFQKLQRRASVRLHLRFHDLRNTALTNWFRNGMSEHDVMRLAGHASFETTHKFYLAVADDLVDRARAATAAGVGQNLRRICGAPTFSGKRD